MFYLVRLLMLPELLCPTPTHWEDPAAPAQNDGLERSCRGVESAGGTTAGILLAPRRAKLRS
jgi:hypothetical protein